jgi:L-fuconolactonase
MNRRDFLATASTILGTAHMLHADDTTLRDGYIDAHSHIWTRDVEAYPLAEGNTVNDLAPPSFTAEELIAAAGKLGITRVVLIQHRPYHGTDNSYITDSIAKFPGVFSAVACIDEVAHASKPNGITREMDRLKGLGARGFRIRPGEGGTADWKDSEAITAMWKHAGEADVAICPLINPADLAMVDRMCQAYPDTRVVVDHFARIGVDGQMRDNDVESLCNLARHPHTHVKISAFYALGRKQPPHDELQPMIRRLFEAYGANRLMWASDNPYQLGPPNTYADSLKLITDRCEFLTPDDRDWLLKKTAERVFFA